MELFLSRATTTNPVTYLLHVNDWRIIRYATLTRPVGQYQPVSAVSANDQGLGRSRRASTRAESRGSGGKWERGRSNDRAIRTARCDGSSEARQGEARLRSISRLPPLKLLSPRRNRAPLECSLSALGSRISGVRAPGRGTQGARAQSSCASPDSESDAARVARWRTTLALLGVLVVVAVQCYRRPLTRAQRRRTTLQRRAGSPGSARPNRGVEGPPGVERSHAPAPPCFRRLSSSCVVLRGK